MKLTNAEVAGLPVDVAVAYIEGYRWFWSKHNYWSIMRPDGTSGSALYESRWTDYDPDTGKKNVPPAHPSNIDLNYWPSSTADETLRLLVKYRLDIISRDRGDAYACSCDWRDGGNFIHSETDAEPGVAVCKAVVALYKASNP